MNSTRHLGRRCAREVLQDARAGPLSFLYHTRTIRRSFSVHSQRPAPQDAPSELDSDQQSEPPGRTEYRALSELREKNVRARKLEEERALGNVFPRQQEGEHDHGTPGERARNIRELQTGRSRPFEKDERHFRNRDRDNETHPPFKLLRLGKEGLENYRPENTGSAQKPYLSNNRERHNGNFRPRRHDERYAQGSESESIGSGRPLGLRDRGDGRTQQRDEMEEARPGRAARTDYVPFEDGTEGANRDDGDSTITPGERKAFEGLFKLHDSTHGTYQSEKANPGGDEITAMLQEVAEENPKPPERPAPSFPKALQSMAQRSGILQKKKPRRAKPKPAETKYGDIEHQKARQAEQDTISAALVHVSSIFQTARSDAELWVLLREQVLAPVAALQLDAPDRKTLPPAKDKAERKARKKERLANARGIASNPTEPPPPTLRPTPTPTPPTPPASHSAHPPPKPEHTTLPVLSANLPTYLTTFNAVLAARFPSRTPLTLALLPSLQTLGPTAFALGISPTLYNTHLHVLWSKFRDVSGVLRTLQDMDKNVVGFEPQTLEVLEGLLRSVDQVLKLRRKDGGVEGWVWRGEKAEREVNAVRGWVRRIRGVLEERALREVREREEASMIGEEDEGVEEEEGEEDEEEDGALEA